MLANTIIIGTDSMLKIIKKLYEEEKITLEQYAECLRRNNELGMNIRKEIIIRGMK